MMTAMATTAEGKRILLLGLSDANIKRLTTGDPIHLNAGTHAIPADIDIMILHGHTEDAIAEKLKWAGVIDPSTKILDTRSKSQI